MYQNIFKRYEKKYLLSASQYCYICEYLTSYTVPDRYADTKVCNIYFDTPNKQLIRSSIEKPVYKEKLRLRCYGDVKNDSRCFLELKKKYKGVVYKRRISAQYDKGLDYLCGKDDCIEPSQIKEEIEYFKNFYPHLSPAMCIFYDRLAFCEKSDPNVRLTFDTNIICRENDLDLTRGVYGKRILSEDMVLLEIKTLGGMPIWLSQMLSRFEIYPSSFSKYGTAYKQSLINGGINSV